MIGENYSKKIELRHLKKKSVNLVQKTCEDIEYYVRPLMNRPKRHKELGISQTNALSKMVLVPIVSIMVVQTCPMMQIS